MADGDLRPVPRLSAYVIQDFEPGFFPWSAQWLMASATYRADDRDDRGLQHVTVAGLFSRVGDRVRARIRLRAAPAPRAPRRDGVAGGPRSRTIVVYGRPRTPRNAFPAIVDGLRAWRARTRATPLAGRFGRPVASRYRPWRRVELRSIGKLDLDGLRAAPRGSAIGVSLMVSPHPSYPPLEMAHLGMLVLTNGFGTKDLSRWHDNIRSTDDISADSLASGCRSCVAGSRPTRFSGSGADRDALTSPSDEPQFPFADELAEALRRGAVPEDRARTSSRRTTRSRR